jgi:hypothetical protein
LGDRREVPARQEAHELEVGRGSEPRDAAFVGRFAGKEPGTVVVGGVIPEQGFSDGSGIIAGGVEVWIWVVSGGVEAAAAPVSVG